MCHTNLTDESPQKIALWRCLKASFKQRQIRERDAILSGSCRVRGGLAGGERSHQLRAA
jgi:hypothetical protein